MQETTAEPVWHQVSGQVKNDVLDMVGKATAQEVIADLEERYTEVSILLHEIGIVTRDIRAEVYKGLVNYAIEGDCSYFLSDGGSDTSLFDQWGNIVGLQELFECFEEYASGPGPSPGLILTLNMLRPRAEVDCARLGAQDACFISLIELGLLAGMKEGSVRNCAVRGNRNYIETCQSGEYTKVDALDAHAWLMRRRRYKPTRLPEKREDRELVLAHLRTFDL